MLVIKMKCINCGNEVENDAVFCDNCGYKLSSTKGDEIINENIPNEPAPLDMMYCPKCGNLCWAGNICDRIICDKCHYEIKPSSFEKCNRCGVELPRKTLFCGNCGQKIESKNAINVYVGKRICPLCQRQYESDVGFCGECGEKTIEYITNAMGVSGVIIQKNEDVASRNIKKHCSTCGNVLDGENEQCNICDEKNFSIRKNKSIKKILLLGVVCMLLIISVAIVGIFGIANCSEDNGIGSDEIKKNYENTGDIMGDTQNVNSKVSEFENDNETKATTREEHIDIIQRIEVNSAYSMVVDNPQYSTYHDDVRGIKIDYPIHFSMANELSEEVDDNYILWKNDDETAVLCVNVVDNINNLTPKEIQDKLIKMYGGKVTYSPIKDEWFALSMNDDIFYHYAYYRVGNDCIKGFEFHFAGKENLSVYSKYIDNIYKSFESI